MRYAFYISGPGRITKIARQFCKCMLDEIILVVSDTKLEPGLQSLLKEKNIVLETINDDELVGTRKEKNLQISNFILHQLQKNNIDYMFSFGAHILSGELLDLYRYRLINFHPAILPMFPGMMPVDQAVNYGNVLLVGNTAHFIDSGMDTGEIIMQSVIPVKHFLDTQDYDVVLDLQIDMLKKLIHVIDDNRLRVIDGRAFIEGADYSRSAIFPET